ncbi:uncharacterized protein LOC122025790 isoform X1 [Zingiber officinale]|uniref:uncharacterized protein LOC122025790 isoform X1 n=1 Tax=Zingiber officinale TaxID=94328 RepID=UPI001C4A9ACB|nr:uncharacterized protein LOC122025790 isoform X1 [Zingiber officinale]XP_042440600.1 uncharacterized protein LOC122025790 isoform X1 [Zingiber officinale]XP_042440601.1 uncharacterized protein LOC122025790 isoform X1 [Zingiber officinale]XP_042440602.1 uncharacterized protein LOC122025790 isoform X1 [Zingiber officinale]
MSNMDANEHENQNEENGMPSAQQEEEAIKKKYGRMVPKKPPLISKASLEVEVEVSLQFYRQFIFLEYSFHNQHYRILMQDHERAYFDSADWALGKQDGHAQKPKGPLEALRPKLQPTPQQQVRSRRSVYASADNEDGGNGASEEMNDNNNYDQ